MTDEAKKPAKPGRKKGTAKTGGRKKGTPNRNSMSVLQSLDKANIPLIEFWVTDILQLDTPHQRIAEWSELARFCYPKLKDIDANPHLQLPPGGASPASPQTPPENPTSQFSREERLSRIRGQVPRKPAAPGK